MKGCRAIYDSYKLRVETFHIGHHNNPNQKWPELGSFKVNMKPQFWGFPQGVIIDLLINQFRYIANSEYFY